MEGITQDLKPHRIKRDYDDLNKMLSSVQSTMNPFGVDPSDDLYCLTSGEKVSDDIKNDLISFMQKG